MILPTDFEMVQAAAASYVRGAAPYFQPAGFVDRLFLVDTPACAIFSTEGTVNFPGWEGDFLALGVREHPTASGPGLSFLHADFYEAALRLFPAVQAVAKTKPVAIGGHSRGAGISAPLAALLIQAGIVPVKVALFAPPRAGAQDLVDLVRNACPTSAYKFGDDPVPEVPFTLPDFPYAQFPLIKIGKPLPIALDCHAIVNYVSGVRDSVEPGAA